MSWYSDVSTGTLSRFRQTPKVELHRHLEGSLRMATLLEIAAQYGIPLPEGNFRTLVQMQPEDPLTFANFLSKFQTLRQLYRTPEIISRVTREAIEDAAHDGVVYMELRFTPVALGRLQGFSLARVMDWVIQSAGEASREYHLPTRLIASVNRHEPVELAEEVARLAAERLAPDADGGMVGLDLAGNEAQFSALPFAGVFREARENGLHITIHAGEWGGAENVRQAIEQLGAERIGHGVRVIEDPNVMALVRERGVPLEVCVTSNFQSGVVATLQDHPLPSLIAAGIPVTLNTDDPTISNITLSGEFHIAHEQCKLSRADLAACIHQGFQASFLPSAAAAQVQEIYQDRITASLPPENDEI